MCGVEYRVEYCLLRLGTDPGPLFALGYVDEVLFIFLSGQCVHGWHVGRLRRAAS